MSSFILKIIAAITMFCDHLGYAIYGQFSAFNYIGRIAFPIFAFQISEGYHYTKNKKNYLMRLLMFALISQVPFMLFSSLFKEGFSLNIFFTLLIGLVAIIGFEQCKDKKWLGIVLVLCLALSADTLHTDYGSWGVIMIFLFHFFREKVLYRNLAFIALILFKYVPLFVLYQFFPPYLFLAIGTLLSLVFIHLYHGKKGRDTKYALYVFYPIHLTLLYLFHLLCI